MSYRRPGQNEANQRDCYLSSHPWAKVEGGMTAGEYLKQKARDRYDKIMKLSNERSERKKNG